VLAEPLAEAKRQCVATGRPTRVFRDVSYRTLDRGSRARRVIGKAEPTLEGANSGCIATSLKRCCMPQARALRREDLYGAPHEAENRVGEPFAVFAHRASSAAMQANQLRMWISAMAYGLVDSLARVALRHGQFADALVATIRLKLLKLGAQGRASVRRIDFAIASGCLNRSAFALAEVYLRRAFSASA
jgi:hypothetical protein